MNNDNEDTTFVNDGAENLSVIPVDADGYATTTALGDGEVSYTIKDENGDTIVNSSEDQGFSDLSKTGNYIVDVSNEDGVLEKHDFEVVDTTETADVRFTLTDIELSSGKGNEDKSDELNNALNDIAEINGTARRNE